jgi:hypothetical protein
MLAYRTQRNIHIAGAVMILQRNQLKQPFMFWLVQEFFAGMQETQEESRPISDREFYIWIVLLFGAVIMYGSIFRFFAA